MKYFTVRKDTFKSSLHLYGKKFILSVMAKIICTINYNRDLRVPNFIKIHSLFLVLCVRTVHSIAIPLQKLWVDACPVMLYCLFQGAICCRLYYSALS